MKTTQIYRTQATAEVTVSTVLIHDGGARFYETAFIVGGRVSDTVYRHTKKHDAGFEHDQCVAVARGYEGKNTKRWDSLESLKKGVT